MPNRPIPGALELRSEPLTVEGRRVRGCIPFGSESRDLGGWRELIEPGALNGANLDDLTARVEHAGIPIGRYPGTLELEHRSDGLHWSVEPPPSRQDVVEAVERGDLRSGSWRMKVARDHWIGDVRHVDKISELQDVSLVTRPAYSASSVELRSQPEGNPVPDTDITPEAPAPVVSTAPPEAVPAPVSTPEDRSQPPAGGGLRVPTGGPGPRRGLADRFRDAGFPGEVATLPFDDVMEERAITYSAAVPLMNQVDRVGGAFPYDERYAWPALPHVGVGADATSVLVALQTARSLASPANVIRAIDAVTAKPETGSTLTLVTIPLNQVANVQSGIPNVYLLQPAIDTIISVDLRLAINDGLDKLVLDAIAASGFHDPGTDPLLLSIRKAMTTLHSEGFNPDTLILTPAAAEALDTLVSGLTGGVNDYVFSPGGFAPGDLFNLNRRISKSAPAPVVLDSQAFGRLYASPVNLARFEENAGGTNTSLLRMELHAACGVERQAAAVRIAAA